MEIVRWGGAVVSSCFSLEILTEFCLFSSSLKTSSYSFKTAISLTPFQQSQLQVKPVMLLLTGIHLGWVIHPSATKASESGQLYCETTQKLTLLHKPEIASHVAEQFFWVPYPPSFALGTLLPIMSLALSRKLSQLYYYSLYHYMINPTLLSFPQE